MKIALMFSGQGSQYLGMGKELYEKYESFRDVFKLAEELTDYPLTEIMFNDEMKLSQTIYTQVCLFTMYHAILTILKEKVVESQYSLGLSLGEYGAYLHNEVFDFETGLKIVKERGFLMEKSTQKTSGKMSAIIGLSEENILNLIKKVPGYITIANYNTNNQFVVSGEEKSILTFNELALINGAKRAILLKTNGAFHSEMMKDAEQEFELFLKDYNLQKPQKNLFINIIGDLYQCDMNIKDALVKQISNSVKFTQMIEKAIDEGIDTFIEIGPKKTLCSFVKKINREVLVLNIEDESSLNQTLTKLEDNNG
ncbi:MAG: ACP S-malonyltransferase [Candidatus Izemoplasmatales bacterium]|nr:ACP S-malonyltransferase [Candidatus Izemoplasmatales bacterium]